MKVSLKINKKLMAIILLLLLVVLAAISFNPVHAVPRITQVNPIELAQGNYLTENTSMEIKGDNFSDQMDLYINGKKLERYTFVNENSILFEVPQIFSQEGIKKIYLKNQRGLFSFIPSNHFKLNVAPFYVDQPKIESAFIQKISPITAQILIKGEGFTDTTKVSLNGQEQFLTLHESDKSISIKITIPDWYLEESFLLILTDQSNSMIRSNAYKLNNPFRFDDDYKMAFNLEYLKNGYLVAHALGELNGKAYTNSMEAFLQNYKAGHRLFEVDLQFTKDDILATLHDIRTDRDIQLYDDKLEIKTFEEEQKALPHTILTFEELCKIMVEYDDIFIITDSKYNSNYRAIKNAADYMEEMINKIDPSLINRFIIQVYNQKMYYFLAQNYHFVSYIYTLYMSEDTDEEVIKFVKATGIPVVTMWHHRATPDFVGKLNELGVFTFVHTINEASKVNDFMQRGIYGSYTDRLTYSDFIIDRTDRFEKFFDEQLSASLKKSALKSYIEELRGEDSLQIIVDRDKSFISLPDEITHSFFGNQTNTNGNRDREGQYDFFIKQGEKILYQSESADQISNILLNDFKIDLAIYADDSKISVSNVDYSISSGGLIFLKLDLPNSIVSEMVYFDTKNGCQMVNMDVSAVNNRRAFIKYLDKINQENYILLFSVNDEGSNALDDILLGRLTALGLKLTLKGALRQSYIAVINNGKVVAEELSPNVIEKCLLVDDWIINVKSGGYEVGSISSIKIDGIEHSQNRRGLNIVVFDKTLGRAVDSVCFDTYYDLSRFPSNPN